MCILRAFSSPKCACGEEPCWWAQGAPRAPQLVRRVALSLQPWFLAILASVLVQREWKWTADTYCIKNESERLIRMWLAKQSQYSQMRIIKGYARNERSRDLTMYDDQSRSAEVVDRWVYVWTPYIPGSLLLCAGFCTKLCAEVLCQKACLWQSSLFVAYWISPVCCCVCMWSWSVIIRNANSLPAQSLAVFLHEFAPSHGAAWLGLLSAS